MDASIAGILLLDGATNGAVYGLLALALVLVFAVTRVIFIPQGEFVAYGALTLALLQLGKVPGTVWLVLVLAVVAEAIERTKLLRERRADLPASAWLVLLGPVLLAAVIILPGLPLFSAMAALLPRGHALQASLLGLQAQMAAAAVYLQRVEPVLATAVVVAVLDAFAAAQRSGRRLAVVLAGAARLGLPLLLVAATLWAAPLKLNIVVQSALAVAIVTLLGPLVYRLAYQRLADATVLVLLIVSVGVHFALTGLGLVFFGAEGFRNPSFWDQRFTLGPLALTGQTVIIFAVALALILGLFLFFGRTLRGKALRATAVNRLGARLMGISTSGAGRLSFGLAAFMGALSGLLIGPTTTVFYDSGFLIGLKGFVAAIFGGLASYPAAALGALMVGVLESFSSFYASAFKEVIVFTFIIPVLLWRSFQHGHDDEEE